MAEMDNTDAQDANIREFKDRVPPEGWQTRWRGHWSPDGDKILTPSGTRVHIWRRNGSLLNSLDANAYWPSALWNPLGSGFLSYGNPNVRLWDANAKLIQDNFTHLEAPEEIGSRTNCGSWRHAGDLVVLGGDTAAIVFPTLGIPETTLQGHYGGITDCGWSSDDELVVTASEDGTARVWRYTGKHFRTLDPHIGAVECVRWAPKQMKLLTCDSERGRIFDLGRSVLPNREVDFYRRVTFDPSGRLVLVVWKGEGYIWNSLITT